MNGKTISKLVENDWKHEWRNTKDYTYMSGDHKTFIDHFLTLETKGFKYFYKRITKAARKYGGIVVGNRQINREAIKIPVPVGYQVFFHVPCRVII